MIRATDASTAFRVTDVPALAGPVDLRLFHEVETAFASAEETCAGELRESWVMFAGRVARLRVAGAALACEIERAFAHLRCPPAVASFTIDLWDTAATGVAPPRFDDAAAGRSWGAGGGLLSSLCEGRVIRHALAHCTTWLDREAQRMVGCVSSAADLSLYERGKPLHYLLSLWHNDRGAYVIHAGLVSTGASGILLAGPGGSGKSTTALACACAGFDFLADDCVALESLDDDRFRGHSLFSAPWIEQTHLSRFPSMLAHASRGAAGQEPKAVVRLDEAMPQRLRRASSIDAIVLPRVTGDRAASLHVISRGEALLALAPSSIVLFAPSPGADGLRRLARLVAAVPTFRLDLGEDVESIPRALASLAGRHAHEHPDH